jgi:hypothetical protein
MENWHWARIGELAGWKKLAPCSAQDWRIGIAEESGGIGCCTVGRQAWREEPEPPVSPSQKGKRGSPKKWRAWISDSSAFLHWVVLELHELVLVNTYLHYVSFKKHMIKFGRKKQVCAMSRGGHINQRPIYRTGITRTEPNWSKPINLVKILQFGGSQIFQMMETIDGWILPESCALYADEHRVNGELPNN